MSILSKSPTEGFLHRLPQVHVAFAAVGAIFRAYANRRAARGIADLPDYLLTDIGLKRDDVHEALSSDWHDDPTYRLALKAAGRRRKP